MKNTLLLILFGLSLTSCAALFAPTPEIDRPSLETRESTAPEGATDH